MERGRGLIALGGPRTLSAGGYAETPLADLFPIRLDPTLRFPVDIDLERFEKNKSPEERIYDEGEFRATPTEAGSVHYLTRLSPNPTENRAIWDRLPPLNSVLRIDEDSVKTSATILLEGIPLTGRRSLATRKPVPLLLTHFYGNGRVTLLTTDSTWRWSMGSPSDEFQRFWRQMILWSSSSDELKEGEIAVQFDRPFFSSGEPVDLHVRYRPLEGVPFDSIDPAVSIISPSGKSFPLPLTPDDRIFEGNFMETTESGDIGFTSK